MATSGQLQGTNSRGGYTMVAKLSPKFRKEAQSEHRFAQFAKIKEAFGAKKGTIVNFTKRGRVATGGGALSENDTVPRDRFPLVQGTCTVQEYGNSIVLTEFLDNTNELNMRSEGMEELKDDYARTKDTAFEAEMSRCPTRYVSSSTATGNFTYNGTATETATTNLNSYHTRTIIDELKTNNCAPAKGGDFWSILTVKAASGLYTDIESVSMYTTLERIAAGEIGRYYQCRFVIDTHSMDGSIGASNVAGEGYFFGYDGGVMEAIALPMELRFEEADLQRTHVIGWYEQVGYKLIWDNTSSDDVYQYRAVKFDSA